MSTHHLLGFRCAACSALARRPEARCISCGEAAPFESAYDLEEVARTLDRASLERREAWIWRFRELLPIDALAELPPLQVGMTPIFGAPRLARWAGLAGLWIKDEGRGLSGTAWDRAAALVATDLRSRGAQGLRRLGCTGPEGVAFAAFAASLGLCAEIGLVADSGARWQERLALLGFQRSDAPLVEVAQGLPILLDGHATIGYELGDQLCERMPDWVVVSASFARGVREGLERMRALGLVREVPRVLAAPDPGPDSSQSPVELDALRAAAAVGLLVGPGGAAALGALRRQVDAGEVEPTATAVVVVDGGLAAFG